MIGTKRLHMSVDEIYNHRSVDVGGSDDDLAFVSRPIKKMKRRASLVGHEMFINILHANHKPQEEEEEKEEESQGQELTQALEVSSTKCTTVGDQGDSHPMISSPCNLRKMKRRLAFFGKNDNNTLDLDDDSYDSPCESSPLSSESTLPPSFQDILTSGRGRDTPCVDCHVQVDKYGIPLAFRRNSNQYRQKFVQKRRVSLDMITMDMDNIEIHSKN